jgi:hypothetical protein
MQGKAATGDGKSDLSLVSPSAPRCCTWRQNPPRDQIAVMRAAGRSICAIARTLQRAKSTVSRELRRNALSSGRYSPLHAAGAYQLRRRREAILEKDQKLRTFVCDRLAEGWTPDVCTMLQGARHVCGAGLGRPTFWRNAENDLDVVLTDFDPAHHGANNLPPAVAVETVESLHDLGGRYISKRFKSILSIFKSRSGNGGA